MKNTRFSRRAFLRAGGAVTQGEKGRPKAHPRVYIGRFEEANKDASYGVNLVQVQRRFIAPDFFLPLESKIPSCRFRLALSDLRLKGHYCFGVTPVESFGKKCRTIWSETVEIKA